MHTKTSLAWSKACEQYPSTKLKCRSSCAGDQIRCVQTTFFSPIDTTKCPVSQISGHQVSKNTRMNSLKARYVEYLPDPLKTIYPGELIPPPCLILKREFPLEKRSSKLWFSRQRKISLGRNFFLEGGMLYESFDSFFRNKRRWKDKRVFKILPILFPSCGPSARNSPSFMSWCRQCASKPSSAISIWSSRRMGGTGHILCTETLATAETLHFASNVICGDQ